MSRPDPPLRLREVLGLSPLPERLRQARTAVRGEVDVPASTVGLSTLQQLRPRLAWPLWRGRFRVPRRAVITNLFNHRQTPIEAGWSVKKTQVLDYRGRDLTYDSHNGTDFAVPVGSTVVSPAPGRVVWWVSEFNRGGLRVCIDHGEGLMSCMAHLARPLVPLGAIVRRGEPIALSGYSGIDALAALSLSPPHVHLNTWLNGVPVDPFPHDGQRSMWRFGDRPLPSQRPDDTSWVPCSFDPDRVAQGIAACVTPEVRERLQHISDRDQQVAALLTAQLYYPTRFSERICPYPEPHPRRPVLDLPFQAGAFDGVVFADDL